MAFMNCHVDHHTIAIGDTDNDVLNRAAFVMSALDAVMRGGARMMDTGHAIEWGLAAGPSLPTGHVGTAERTFQAGAARGAPRPQP